MWQEIKGAINQVISDNVPTKRTAVRHTHPLVDTQLCRVRRRKYRAYMKTSTIRVKPAGKGVEGLGTRVREISEKLTNGI